MKENPIKIIIFSDAIKFESGNRTNLMCLSGSLEEVEKTAKKIAEKYGTKVIAIN